MTSRVAVYSRVAVQDQVSGATLDRQVEHLLAFPREHIRTVAAEQIYGNERAVCSSTGPPSTNCGPLWPTATSISSWSPDPTVSPATTKR